MRKLVLVLVVVGVLAGCGGKSTGLVTHGEFDGPVYVTADGSVKMLAPLGWEWSNDRVEEAERSIAKASVRPHELGYLIHKSLGALIVVESYALTWRGEPIIPVDVTWDPRPERITRSCEDKLESERSSRFASYEYECYVPQRGAACLPHDPCLLSWRKRVSGRAGGGIIYDKTYIVGLPFKTPVPKGEHGWYINIAVICEKESLQEAKAAADVLAASMRLTNR